MNNKIQSVVCCKNCYENYGEKEEVKYTMFDVDGYNLEEFPVCPKSKYDCNIENNHIDLKTNEEFTLSYLDPIEGVITLEV